MKFLLIGGPHHGKALNIGKDLHRVELPKEKLPVDFRPYTSDTLPGSIETTYYDTTQLAYGGGSEFITYYAHFLLSPDEAGRLCFLFMMQMATEHAPTL